MSAQGTVPGTAAPADATASSAGRRTSFGAGNDGAGGGYYKNLEKKRRGSQSHSDAAKDMMRKDTIGDAWSNLFK